MFKQSVIIFFLLPIHALSQSGGMYQKIIQDSLSANTTTDANTCYNFSSNIDDQFANFEGNVNCSFQCVGKDKRSLSINKIFDTREQKMKKGDGGLWASLTTTLKYWSEEVCLNKAKQECSKVENIKDFNVSSIQSESWSISPNQLNCDKSNGITDSPFDSKKGVSRVNIPTLLSTTPPKSFYDWRNNSNISAHNNSEELQKPLASCKNILKGNFCYGDCISFEEEMSEYLTSSEPLANDEIDICADEMLKEIKELNYSNRIGQHMCETYFLSKLKSAGVLGLSCASSRFSSNCEQLLVKI